MSDKPRYLGLLNAIALAESRAHTYLCAWAEVTPSNDVRNVLRTVAAREGEHAMSFAKRIDELGYQVRPKDDSRPGQGDGVGDVEPVGPREDESAEAPPSRHW